MKNKFYRTVLTHLNWVFALLFTFWIFSLVEVFSNKTDEITFLTALKSISFKFLNDFWTVSIIAIFLFPITYFISEKKEKLYHFLFIIFGIIIVLIQLSLVKYSLVSKLNLGSDLLGYSCDDIVLTVSSSTSFSIISLLSFFLAPALFLIIRFFFRKKDVEKILLFSFLILLTITISTLIFSSEIKNDVYQNKINFLVSDILSSKMNQNQAYTINSKGEFPLLKPIESNKDVLKPFFKIDSLQRKPNIVIIIMEGLGSEFVDNNQYSGYSPFIDSLIGKSLYWENFLSTTGRTFGVLPSLLGSLPYGEMGFLEIENTPTHQSLFSILNENGYTSSYYTGSKSSFDKVVNFLEYNEVKHIIDENKFGFEFEKAANDNKGFSWGYPDSELFKKMLSTLDEKNEPRLDVLLTVSNHEPFSFPNKNIYTSNAENIFKNKKNNTISTTIFNTNKDVFSALNYVDNSLEKFFNDYQKRADFQNTIFIITGDHRLIPIEQKDELCRFHVPLIIYSPLLKKPQRFQSISSHWDVTPSLISFLKNNYHIKTKNQTSWMGNGLDTTKNFRNSHQIPLMRYKGSFKDFVFKEYFYSDEILYKINKNFDITEINDSKILKQVKDSFAYFKELNVYLTKQNKILPDSLKRKKIIKKIIFTESQLIKINEVAKGKTSDELFPIARQKAFDGDREFARLLCDFVLNESPDHVDFIILKGRTLAWDGKYVAAEKALLEAIDKFPYYDDPYLALMDTYIWSDQTLKSIEIGKIALKNHLKNPEISFKIAKSYNILQKKETSLQIIDSLIKMYPKNEDFLKFKKTLK